MRVTPRATLLALAGLMLATAQISVGSPPNSIPANAAAAAVAPDPRPNIVVITTDDMRVSDLEAMPTVRTRLGGQGTTFTNSYASFPLCCPSRATMMTGQYAHNHGVLGNGSPVGGYADFDPSSTVATWLRAAGYQTGMVGKFLNRFGAQKPIRVPPGWTDFHAAVGGGHYFDTRLFENGKARQYTGPYQTDLYTDVAVDVLERHLPADAPLFLWTSYYAPHLGRPVESDDPKIGTPAPAPRHRNHFSTRALPTTDPAFNEADVSDKPSMVRNKRRLTSTMQAQLRESYQQRLESLLAVDEGVSRLLDTIAASGELDNTVIVFTSDNGWMMGEHRIHAGKTVVYEPSAKVPLIARGPGFPDNVTRSQLVANIDLAPTFVDLADAQAGLTMDGTSLLPVATSDTGGPDRDLLLEAGPLQAGDPMFYHAIRTERWLYVEYPKTNERELYDMQVDPHQLANLAGSATHAPTRSQLSDALAALRSCAGATCR
jgi:N-acetylglucosamine-6-sulfatase